MLAPCCWQPAVRCLAILPQQPGRQHMHAHHEPQQSPNSSPSSPAAAHHVGPPAQLAHGVALIHRGVAAPCLHAAEQLVQVEAQVHRLVVCAAGEQLDGVLAGLKRGDRQVSAWGGQHGPASRAVTQQSALCCCCAALTWGPRPGSCQQHTLRIENQAACSIQQPLGMPGTQLAAACSPASQPGCLPCPPHLVEADDGVEARHVDVVQPQQEAAAEQRVTGGHHAAWDEAVLQQGGGLELDHARVGVGLPAGATRGQAW
jgi:hypothetical protein